MAWLPRLDTRLNCIAEEVPACNLAADIGADHGKLSCWLLASGRVQRMIVSDISKVSRDKARDLFIRHEVMDRVTLLWADGLHAIAGSRPDVVIIAGMGGALVADILRQPVDLQGARLILSAHTELPLVRAALQARSYAILRETLVRAAGRYYRVITARPGEQALSPAQMELGVHLRGYAGADVRAYFRWQLEVARDWQGERGARYRTYLEEALDGYTGDDRTGSS